MSITLRLSVAAGLYTLTLAAAAIAQSLLDPRLSKGLVMETPAGAKAVIAFDAAGGFRSDTGDSGGWSLEGDTLCLVPLTGGSHCTQVPADAKPGDTWSTSDGDGGATVFAIPANGAADPEL